ncbi:hypothetical protein D3C76_345630 [compost metagenome]
MKINFKTWLAIIYISFAFDSALKLNAGIQLHVGLVAILLTNAIFTLTRPAQIAKTVVRNFYFFLFFLYCTSIGLIQSKPGFLAILTYIAISANVLIFVNLTYKKWDRNFFIYFQLVLIATGLFQYALFKVFGTQISFIEEEHYQKGSSVSLRLRGFFIEPNWFAIAITFNTLLLIGNDVFSFIRKHYWITIFSALTIILNGSLATIGMLVIVYALPLLKKNPVKGGIIMLLMISLMYGAFSFRNEINQKGENETVLNYNSRWLPLTRVIEYQQNQSLGTILLGNGIGSWGTEAVRNRLSVLVYEEESSARDGSELPVFIFELGILGLALLMLDGAITFIRTPSSLFNVRGGIILFFACLIFYPTLKFWMYMPYYFYMRAIANSERIKSRNTKTSATREPEIGRNLAPN